MDGSKTALERAFELAKSGVFQNVSDIRKALGREGYNAGQIEGPNLQAQLRELILAAKKNTAADEV